MSTSLLTISAFYAGNVLDFLTATFIFAFILGYLLSKMRQEKKEANLLASFFNFNFSNEGGVRNSY